MLYRRLCNTTAGGTGYELKKEFMEFLKTNKVPDEAWQYENIETIESNMLNGAGSPSFKLMAAEKTLQFLQIMPKTPGEYLAQQDAIAAIQGRQNVKRYLPDQPLNQISDEDRIIGFENAGMSDHTANIENFIVKPTDNQTEHFRGHFSDAMLDCDKIEGMFQQQADVDEIGEMLQSLMMLKGPHMQAHLNMLAGDKSKEGDVMVFAKNFGVLQGRVDHLMQMYQEMKQSQQQEGPQTQGQSPEDVKLQKEAALAGIKVDTAKKLSDMKVASKALDHQLKQDQTKERAATSIAVQRATAATQNQLAIERAKADAEAMKQKTQTEQTT
jgi:hypothetical protein